MEFTSPLPRRLRLLSVIMHPWCPRCNPSRYTAFVTAGLHHAWVAEVGPKAMVLLVIHCSMFLQLFVGGSVFGPSFVMHYLVSFLVLKSS